MSTEVLQQRGYVTVSLLQLDRRSGEVVETTVFASQWHAQPMVLMGKSAPVILQGLALGMPFSFCTSAWDEWSAALLASTDYALLQQMGDKGSSNLPAMKHLAAEWGDMARALRDVSSCELHTIQNLKNMNFNAKQSVGRMYSLSNMMKVATFIDGLTACIEQMCSTTIRRLAMPPPAAIKDDMTTLLDTLYDFSAEHHKRSGTRGDSTLLEDLRALAAVPLSELQGQTLADGPDGLQIRAHYCWDAAKQRPCCESEQETIEKATVALINFHCGSAFDRVSLSRFTHVAKARKRLLVGLAHQRLFFGAAAAAASKSVELTGVGEPVVPEIKAPAEELGAGASDYQLKHGQPWGTDFPTVLMRKACRKYHASICARVPGAALKASALSGLGPSNLRQDYPDFWRLPMTCPSGLSI